MRKKAYIDPLTKVYNRQYLPDFLATNSLKNYLLIMMDLDNFKHINDNYGHDVGDEVLISVVENIKKNIRQEDVLIRFGGEEFLLFVKKEEGNDYTLLAERIRKSIMNLKIQSWNQTLNITLSLGVNPFPDKAKNIEEAIKIADEQLYLAKSSGRNRVEVFDEMNLSSNHTLSRISDIQSAIDHDRVTCAFQPIFSAIDREIEKYEILMRIMDQKGGYIPPNSFLPTIRHTQVYISLTSIILNRAIEMLTSREDVQFSINLDIQDIVNQDIMKLFQSRFANQKELASRMTVEILEHEEIKNFEPIYNNLLILRNLGFTIALDDFGSGYSNYKYILNLKIDILKIDGSLIKNIDSDTAAQNILKSIVTFAKNMEMQIVAEQVETKEEYDVVVDLGVDYIQGYYLGYPKFTI